MEMVNYSLPLAKPVIGSLASSKPLTTTRSSVSLFRPAETGRLSSRCFASLKSSCRETDCEYNFNLKIPGPMEARPRFHDADITERGHIINELCHRVSATRNLARLLNLMDRGHKRHIGFGIAPCGHARWDVIQDAKALHLFYNMSGIPRKDTNADHNKDVQGAKCDFRHVRVLSNSKRMISDIIIEETGHHVRDPKATYKLYSIRLHLRDCIVSDAKVDMESEVLKITIPKKEEKWIHIIRVEPKFFWPSTSLEQNFGMPSFAKSPKAGGYIIC